MSGKEIYFIGWDVGAWHCDKNRKSRDALFILDRDEKEIGKWRGNLKDTLLDAKISNAGEWAKELFRLCKLDPDQTDGAEIVVAIDAPLGFPDAARSLLCGHTVPLQAGDKPCENLYLYRETERHLFRHHHQPLSSIKDMIGSQSTKAMHAASKFFGESVSTGIWRKGDFTAIETYPAICFQEKRKGEPKPKKGVLSDLYDAGVCAKVARWFHFHRDRFDEPPSTVPENEGWIWYPRRSDASTKAAIADRHES